MPDPGMGDGGRLTDQDALELTRIRLLSVNQGFQQLYQIRETVYHLLIYQRDFTAAGNIVLPYQFRGPVRELFYSGQISRNLHPHLGLSQIDHQVQCHAFRPLPESRLRGVARFFRQPPCCLQPPVCVADVIDQRARLTVPLIRGKYGPTERGQGQSGLKPLRRTLEV